MKIAISIVATVLVLVLFVGIPACSRVQTATGTKVGSVIKLSNAGFWHRTWEGELVRGGMNNGSGAFSITPLHFTVQDERLLNAVQDALDKQYEVEVTYAQYVWRPWDSDNGEIFLTSIKRR